MVARLELTTRLLKPQGLLLLALATTFAAEYLIMKLLPLILPAGCGATCEAMLDACLLTLVVAPVLWLTALRPLQRMAQSHMLFLRRALTSQEEERQRITREIHDGIGQSLTSLMLGLRALEETTGDSKTCDNARSLREMGSGIHDELRRIVRGLRPAILDQLGLAAATLRLAEDIRNTSASTLEVDVEKLVGVRLDSELESNSFRILQEAIANAMRHASAKLIRVTADIRNNNLELTVEDNGHGFDMGNVIKNIRSGYGIASIRERAMICGGRAELTTGPGKGTTVFAQLPLKNRRKNCD